MNRRSVAVTLRWILGAAIAVACGVALATQWDRIGSRFGLLSPTMSALAFVPTLAGVGASMLAWRAVLAELGSPLPLASAARVFFPGQVAKYVPGSVWTVVSQMELARRYGIPRIRAATATAVSLVMAILSGILVALVTLPLTAAPEARRYRWLLIAVPFLLVTIHPRVLTVLVNAALRLVRRPALEDGIGFRGLAEGLLWTVIMWFFYGAQLAMLAADLGASGIRLLPLATGAFAAAWTAGFLVLIAPAGAGVREAGIVLLLAPSLGAPKATVAALVSRLLLTVADAVLALVSLPTSTRAPARIDQA